MEKLYLYKKPKQKHGQVFSGLGGVGVSLKLILNILKSKFLLFQALFLYSFFLKQCLSITKDIVARESNLFFYYIVNQQFKTILKKEVLKGVKGVYNGWYNSNYGVPIKL